jgi:uncharacterized protein YprB with RNaseH-like and TPR domain
MDEQLMARLRRLGVVKGARELRLPSAAPEAARPAGPPRRGPLEQLLPGGRVIESDDGGCFVIDRVYATHHRHGGDALADLLGSRPAAGAPYVREPRLETLDFRDFLFLDTETTGLAGAGTLAFMVGVAYFERQVTSNDVDIEDDVLVVRQYFLRDHGDERAMLRQLDALLAERAGLITFNGRSFDVPLLDNRYLMNRLPSRLLDLPHIDLLLPARRLFRARLGSCALSSLERTLLGLERSHADVPGALIPALYYQYLRTGEVGELARVFYHNEMDMLSMVTLAARIFRQLEASCCDDPLDQLSLARWQADLGLGERAEATLRASLDGDLPFETYHEGLYRLAALLKAGGRRDEAVVVWQQIAHTSSHDVGAHVELAKHYEWVERNAAEALVWTERALALVARWTPTPNARLARAELGHRWERLVRKQS